MPRTTKRETQAQAQLRVVEELARFRSTFITGGALFSLTDLAVRAKVPFDITSIFGGIVVDFRVPNEDGGISYYNLDSRVVEPWQVDLIYDHLQSRLAALDIVLREKVKEVLAELSTEEMVALRQELARQKCQGF